MNTSPLDLTTRLQAALTAATEVLLGARAPEGHWEGTLSSSALSTATAVCALAVAHREAGEKHNSHDDPHLLIARGLEWLARHANSDGGWGDTILSHSNLSTTTLVWAAFGAAPGEAKRHRATIYEAERWLAQQAGGLEPETLAPAIIRRYGKDRTFSVPILTMCALAGRLGQGREAWRHVIPLPFELAALPHHFFAALRLPVVSYALPALIAIGQACDHHRPPGNPIVRWMRQAARSRTLRVLEEIQPENGGFLEATPLTSFVCMSLAGSGQAGHPVVRKGLEFLRTAQREDGSWPIDTNLATWVTTLAVNALGELGSVATASIRPWLLHQQHRREHPYTHAAPGGWAWTPLPGGVPDADDTAGALLALRRLEPAGAPAPQAVEMGIQWLLGLQNRDGGIPTFCRGWGALPFDRSSPDLTAHALRAWQAWRDFLPSPGPGRVSRAMDRALAYLREVQRPDGSWVPLWFGNQHAPEEENPTYGTARVISALASLPCLAQNHPNANQALCHGLDWLVRAQTKDGGWSGANGGPPSVEETALAVEALAGALASPAISGFPDQARAQAALERGVLWLVERVESGAWPEPAPIGFYFAKLWYFERLYPLIFTVGALREAAHTISTGHFGAASKNACP